MTKLTCPDCGKPMLLRDGQYGQFYGCTGYPKCKTTQGARSDGRPIGVPSDGETKTWRIKAHQAFDAMYRDTSLRRDEAYTWMADAMGLTKEEAHIAAFTIGQCKQLIMLIEQDRRA